MKFGWYCAFLLGLFTYSTAASGDSSAPDTLNLTYIPGLGSNLPNDGPLTLTDAEAVNRIYHDIVALPVYDPEYNGRNFNHVFRVGCDPHHLSAPENSPQYKLEFFQKSKLKETVRTASCDRVYWGNNNVRFSIYPDALTEDWPIFLDKLSALSPEDINATSLKITAHAPHGDICDSQKPETETVTIIKDKKAIARLYDSMQSLPFDYGIMPNEGAVNCPNDTGASLHLDFSSRGKVVRKTDIKLNGCRHVDLGNQHKLRVPTDKFQRLLLDITKVDMNNLSTMCKEKGDEL